MGNRLIGLTAVGVAYAVIASVLVHLGGDAHRRALRERRQLAAAPARPAPPDVSPEPAPTPAPPAPEPTPAPEATKPVPPPTPPPAPAAVPVKPSTPKPPPAREAPPVTLPALVVNGLENLPAEEEARLGKVLHMLILANHGADEDSPYQRAITAATRAIVDTRARKDVEVTITVLDSNEVNAFSHLGGYIYVTRGLFNLAATEEEFAFVVGHELAHVDLRHAQELVAAATREGRLNGVGTLQALYHQIAEGYTEAQEDEADDWVVDRMVKLDHTKRDCLAFVRKLEKYSEEHGFRNGRKAPKSPPTAPVQDIDNHYRSQPAAWKRKERLAARLTTGPGPSAGAGRPATAR